MPLASTCPQCCRQVSLPREADPSVRVRCPLCHAEYSLQEAIDFIPPELEIITSPDSAAMESVITSAAITSAAIEESAIVDDAITPNISSVVSDAASEESMHAADGSFGVGIFEDTRQETSTPTENTFSGNLSDSHALMEAGEDDDTLPTMEPGTLAPPMRLSELESAPQGFREAPAFSPEELSAEHEVAGDVAVAESEWNLQPESHRLPATPTGEFTPSFDATPRRKRKEKSLVGEVVKIVIANVIAFPILYGGILWGFKKDPLQLAQYLPPSIVPPEFQAKQPQSKVQGDSQKLANRPTDDETLEKALSPTTPDEPQPKPSDDLAERKVSPAQHPIPGGISPETAPADLELPPLERDKPKSEAPTISPPEETPLVPSSPAIADSSKTLETPGGTIPTTPDTVAPAPVQPTPSTPDIVPSTPTIPAEPATSVPPKEPEIAPSTNILAPEPKSGDTKPVDPFGPDDGTFPPPPGPATPAPVKEVPKLGPKMATTYAVSDTATAMEAVNSAAASLAAADRANAAELRNLRVAYYTALSQLAEKTTLLGGESSDIAAAQSGAAAQLAGVVDNAAKLDELSRLAGFWFNAPKRASDGIALAGTTQETVAEGKYFRTDVKLLGSETILPVLSSEKPELPSGSTVLVLGVVVKDPAQNLYDYEGHSQGPVIWAGAITDAKE